MAKIPGLRDKEISTLYYRGQSINPKTFNKDGKDLRRLVGFCYDCGRCLRGRLAIPAPDPYQADINNDETPVVQCENCAAETAEDI